MTTLCLFYIREECVYMAKAFVLPDAERAILEASLTDALALRDELEEGVEAGIMSDLLLQAHNETIAKARALLSFSSTA